MSERKKGASLSVKEASRLLSAHENKVRELILRGELEAWRLGSHYRIEAEALEEFKNRQRVGQPKRSRLRALEGRRR